MTIRINNPYKLQYTSLNQKSDPYSFSGIKNMPDTVSFTGTYIDKREIPKIISAFAKELFGLLKNNQMTIHSVQEAMNRYRGDIPVILEDLSKHVGTEENKSVFHDLDFNVKGKARSYLYVDFSIPEQIKIIPALIHEFTHVLQINAQRDFHLTQMALKSGILDRLNNAQSEIDRRLMILISGHNEDKLLDKIPRTGIEKLLKFIQKDRNKLSGIYDMIINAALSKYDITDRQLALEFLEKNARNEAVAYREEYKIIKKIFREKGRYNYDFIPQMYEDFARYLNEQRIKGA